MVELSQNAINLCAGWFSFGVKSSVRSHPPHETYWKNKAAVDELLAAGLISRREFNGHGTFELVGTDEAGQIGRKRAAEQMAELFAPPPSREESL